MLHKIASRSPILALKTNYVESNFYTAIYELDSANSQVFHTVLQSSVKDIIGQRMQRDVRLLADGRLWLSGIGLKERVSLIWLKID